MTKSNDNDLSYLTARQNLRETEQLEGIEPLERDDECPEAHELLNALLNKITPDLMKEIRTEAALARWAWIEKHTAGCIYCSESTRSLERCLNKEPLPELPKDVEDPVAPLDYER